MMRLADKTALRIMSISKAVRSGATTPTVVEQPVPVPVALPDTSTARSGASSGSTVAPTDTGVLPGLNEAPVDKPSVLQGRSMFDALIEGQG